MAALSDKTIELIKRTGSGAGIGAVVLVAVAQGGRLWSSLAGIIALISLNEFYKILNQRLKLSKTIGILAGAILLVMTGFLDVREKCVLTGLVLAFLMTLFAEIIKRQSIGNSTAIENSSGVAAGLIYVVLPWCFSIFLRNNPVGKTVMLSVFLCTWSCDVFAFLVGSWFGRHKLCDRISPKKTWEGFFSGVAGSFLASGAVAYLRQFPPFPILVIGLICGIAGQMGDLGESIFKREAGVKDSGDVIPGHGGMLDRFDSILVNLTITYLLFEVIWR